MKFTKWTLASAFTGAVLYLTILHRFGTYTERNHAMEDQAMIFAAAMLVAGFGLALAAVHEEWAVAKAVMLGVLGTHAIAIVFDLLEDKSNHNMLPFEMIAFALLAAPAFVGAGAVKLFRR
jgi:hypothetical protein